MSKLAKAIDVPPFKVYGPMFDEFCRRWPLGPISSEQHHRSAIRLLGLLGEHLDSGTVPSSAVNDLIAYATGLQEFVRVYESGLHSSRASTPAEILKDLMERNGLNQSSFKNEIGAQPVVSRILAGERQLTREHIEALSKRFNVSPAIFF